MPKLIGIFILATQLQVAKDGDATVATFANSADGAEQLFDHVLDKVMPAPRGVHILIGMTEDDAPLDAVINYLNEFDIKYGIVLPKEMQEAVSDKEPLSAKAVIKGFKLRRERIFGRK